jgi:hypothetical protein
MSTVVDYATFLQRKAQDDNEFGFHPEALPEFLFDFQRALVDWSLAKGRSAIFADCGLGKTPMQLVWADQVVRRTNGRVLIATPIAVGHQTVAEGAKFGIECHRSHAGELRRGINVTNYERLHHFDPSDFVGMVLDESSILKSFDGRRRQEITEFMRKLPYRLLCTATAAPNDYIELGTSSEALGHLGYMDMLGRFFKNDQNTIKPMVYRHQGQNFQKLDERAKWRFKGHAEQPFWRWVCSWARAIRRPSDLAFDDRAFVLPSLMEREHLVEVQSTADGMLFNLPAVGLQEQREERRRSIVERCNRVAELVADTGEPALVWCHLNDEGDQLASIIPGAVQVSGDDSEEAKEEKFMAFASRQIRVLVTKPKIGAWGLNFQHCAHVTFFPSHSFEQYYQGVRRCWRFGQTRPVRVDVVTSEGEQSVLANLQRKADAADRMFSSLVGHMNDALRVERSAKLTHHAEVPKWM